MHREQVDREQALDDFKTGYVKILIATDVASRGLDVKDITYVNLNCFKNVSRKLLISILHWYQQEVLIALNSVLQFNYD